MKLKLNSSGPGLFEPSHCHTTSLISSSEKTSISRRLSPDESDLNSTPSSLTLKSFVALNLASKSFLASYRTVLGSSHQQPPT